MASQPRYLSPATTGGHTGNEGCLLNIYLSCSVTQWHVEGSVIDSDECYCFVHKNKIISQVIRAE